MDMTDLANIIAIGIFSISAIGIIWMFFFAVHKVYGDDDDRPQ